MYKYSTELISCLCLITICLSWTDAKISNREENSSTKRVKRAAARDDFHDPIDEEHEDTGESDDTHAYEWTVKLDTSSLNDARLIAKRYGFDHVSDIEGIHGLYRFIRESHDSERKKEADTDDTGERTIDNVKEALTSKREHVEKARLLASDENIRWIRRERFLEREKRAPIEHKSQAHVIDTFNDPELKNQWYIKNKGQTSGPANFDSHVSPVWDMGLSGKGVTLSVLDDGMDHSHPDLIQNYDPLSSKDLNGLDDDPMPNDSDPYNAHGTKCTGTISAQANNSICGVGIAFNSKVGAIRMLDGKATDSLEADALSFHRDHINLYSCSWGPKDNGATFGRPGKLGRIALEQGAKQGRGGLGSLFIWATGNGGIMKDDCNADGYVNSIYTVGIGSVNEHDVSTYYGERCSAAMAVTYCSGQHGNGWSNSRANVITTYLHHQCTEHFVGTSSAAPLAAGIFALVLEANPKLTWRDLQHLVFETAVQTSPLDDGWMKNGVGRLYNHKFGFGVLDAHKLVIKALNWSTVPEQRACHFKLNFKNGQIPSGHHFKLNFTTDGCQKCSDKMKGADGKCKNAVTKLEHVVATVTLKHRCRGHLNIDLISPHSTVSHLLHVRPNDNSDKGLKGWSFMTVFNWGENPAGTWSLVFNDNNDHEGERKEKRDMEEIYMKLLDRKKKSVTEHGRVEYDSDKRGGFSENQIEEIQRYLSERDAESTENLARAVGIVEEQDETEDDEPEVEAERINEKESSKRAMEYARNAYPEKRESRLYDEDVKYGSRYPMKRDYRYDYRYDEYRKRRDVDDESDVKRVEDMDGPRSAASKRSGANHICKNKMKDPKLAASDVAGDVMEISITLYGSR